MSTTFEYSIILLCRCNTCRKLVTLKTHPQNSSSSFRCPNCNNSGCIEKITREQLSESLLTSARPFLEDFPNDPYIYIPRNHNTDEGFDYYYDDGSGFGFTQVQPEYLAPSRQDFNRTISQFGFSEFNLLPRVDDATSAIALIPTIEIQESHVSRNPNCSVCLQPFGLETKAKEMPECKHLYHSDCIQPWLELRDSCPLCRRQLSFDEAVTSSSSSTDEEEEDVVGLVVWRLAGDIVGLGRFSGGERIFEVIFRDTPESLISRDYFRGNNNGVRKRIRFRRVFKSLFSRFNGVGRAIVSSN